MSVLVKNQGQVHHDAVVPQQYFHYDHHHDDDDDEDDEVDEEEARTNRHLRIASSNAEKSQSWRGDNPLRSNQTFAPVSAAKRHGHFFEHEVRAQQIPTEDTRISMPFR